MKLTFARHQTSEVYKDQSTYPNNFARPNIV
jgi:hypothetical protein